MRTLIFLIAGVAILGVAAFLIWHVSGIGESRQTDAKIRNAFLDANVDVPGSKDAIPRIVVEMEIRFPMGRVPNTINDLQIIGDDGRPVEVDWGTKPPETRDIEDEGITCWVVPEAFLAPDFKGGWLADKRTGRRDLCYIRLPALSSAPSQ